MEMVIEKSQNLKTRQKIPNIPLIWQLNAEMFALYIFCVICILSRITHFLKITLTVVLFSSIIPDITFVYFKACVQKLVRFQIV